MGNTLNKSRELTSNSFSGNNKSHEYNELSGNVKSNEFSSNSYNEFSGNTKPHEYKSELITPKYISTYIENKKQLEQENLWAKYDLIKNAINKSINLQFKYETNDHYKFHLAVKYKYYNYMHITYNVIKCLRDMFEKEGWIFTIHHSVTKPYNYGKYHMKIDISGDKSNKLPSTSYYTIILYTEQLSTVPDNKCIYKTPEKFFKEETCVICKDNKTDTFYFPCYHFITCFSCALSHVKTSDNCPVCNAKIQSTIRDL
jgi:hypothetical protein